MPKTKKKNKHAKVSEEQIIKNGIFNFDEEIQKPKKKVNKALSKKKKVQDEDYFIGTKELPPISKKKLKKIKKDKAKEKKTKDKELRQVQKEQEKTNKERIKRNRRARQTEEQIKRRAKIKLVTKIISLIVVLLGTLIFLMLSPIFNIKNIVVEKNEQISTEQIISLSRIEKETNMFKVSNKETINAIKENPYVKKVEVKRALPDTIKLIITERKVNFMLEYGSSYAYMDNHGYILEISASIKEGIPKIKGYETKQEDIVAGNRLCSEDLKKLNTVLKIMYSAKINEIDNKITTINIEDQNNYSLYFEQEKKTAYLGDCTTLDTRMLYIKVILEKEKEHEGEIIVDMDLNDKSPFFREKV